MIVVILTLIQYLRTMICNSLVLYRCKWSQTMYWLNIYNTAYAVHGSTRDKTIAHWAFLSIFIYKVYVCKPCSTASVRVITKPAGGRRTSIYLTKLTMKVRAYVAPSGSEGIRTPIGKWGHTYPHRTERRSAHTYAIWSLRHCHSILVITRVIIPFLIT